MPFTYNRLHEIKVKANLPSVIKGALKHEARILPCLIIEFHFNVGK